MPRGTQGKPSLCCYEFIQHVKKKLILPMCKFLLYLLIMENYLFIVTEMGHIVNDTDLFLLINLLTNNTFFICSFTWITKYVSSSALGFFLFYQYWLQRDPQDLLCKGKFLPNFFFFFVGFCSLTLSIEY